MRERRQPMITKSTLSILGLYNYDPTIFDDMALPAVITDKGNEYLIHSSILLEYAEMEVLYPDPNVMKQAIAIWSKSRFHAWTRMAEVLYEDYDPYINIKRDEVRVITQERDLAGSGTSTNKVSAWNANTYSDRSMNDTQTTDTGTITTTESFHVEGDSAITDAQDVLRKEMDVRIEYDLINIIKEEFKTRFLLEIY